MALLEAQGLTKYFRPNWGWRRIGVLKGIDLAVEEGEIFGLIGPNGAGKTTTFKSLLGLLRPSSGTVTFCGRPLDTAARAAIGFLPEQPYFYDYLTVEEMLDFYARLHNLRGTTRRNRVNEVIDQLQLTAKRRSALRTLSKGTLQRVGVAQAIINTPRLVILDEPMSGLDPAGRRHMRELILSLQRHGTTVIFASHILPDAEALCTRVGILVQGSLREVVELRTEAAVQPYVIAVSGLDAANLTTLEQIAGNRLNPDGDRWLVRLTGQVAVSAVLDAVRACDGAVESLTPVHISLEERFLTYVDHAASLD